MTKERYKPWVKISSANETHESDKKYVALKISGNYETKQSAT
jgi:hypothetical protein